MTSEALQNQYFVMLFCIRILTKHFSNYNIVQNRSFDKLKILWALKFQKKGGTTLKSEGGTDPVPCPPPPKSALEMNPKIPKCLLLQFCPCETINDLGLQGRINKISHI